MSLPDAFIARPITHRGLHDVTNGRAENSPKAFAAAMDHGYGIELDLQLSSDHVPMVFHDYDLGRLTDATGAVAQRTAAELGQIPLKHDGDGIPTLAQVLDQVAGRVPLVIEIKDQDGALGPNVGPMGAQVAALLRDYDGYVAVMSFNPHSVAALADRAPLVPRGLTTCDFLQKDWPTIPKARLAELAEIPDFERARASFISHQASDLASPWLAPIRAKGVPVLTWTIRSRMEEAEARKLADNVTFEGYLPA